MKDSNERKEGFELCGNIFYSFVEVYPEQKGHEVSQYFNDVYYFVYTDLESISLDYEYEV